MKSTPCEHIFWDGLPVIRREIAECMIKNYGLNQKQAAEKLGITPAAVCQYMSKKRGKIKIIDEKITYEINISAERIIQSGKDILSAETCRICKLLQKEGIFNY